MNFCFESLPDDIIQHTFLNLPNQDLFNLRLVCRSFCQDIEQVFKILCHQQIGQTILLSQMDQYSEARLKDFDWRTEYYGDNKKLAQSPQLFANRRFYILFRLLNDLFWDPNFASKFIDIKTQTRITTNYNETETIYSPCLANRQIPQNKITTWWIQFHMKKIWACLGISSRNINFQLDANLKEIFWNQDTVYCLASWNQIYQNVQGSYLALQDWSTFESWKPLFVRLDCDLKNGLLMITSHEENQTSISRIIELDPSHKSEVSFYPYAMLAGTNIELEIHSVLKNDVPKWIKEFKPDWEKTHVFAWSKKKKYYY